jgi:hypothetical protein
MLSNYRQQNESHKENAEWKTWTPEYILYDSIYTEFMKIEDAFLYYENLASYLPFGGWWLRGRNEGGFWSDTNVIVLDLLVT